MKKFGLIIAMLLTFAKGCTTTEKVAQNENQSAEETTLSDSCSTQSNNMDATILIEASETEKMSTKPVDNIYINDKSTMLKIAHINTMEILNAMSEYTEAEASLRTYRVELENDLKAMYSEYQKKLKEFEASQNTMSDLMKRTKQNELVDFQNRIIQFQENVEKDYELKKTELLEPVMKKLQVAISDVTKENGYSFVFDINNIITTGDNAIDATNLVKTKLGI